MPETGSETNEDAVPEPKKESTQEYTGQTGCPEAGLPGAEVRGGQGLS